MSWPGLGVSTRNVFDIFEDRRLGFDEKETLLIRSARRKKYPLLPKLLVRGDYLVVHTLLEDECIIPQLQ